MVQYILLESRRSSHQGDAGRIPNAEGMAGSGPEGLHRVLRCPHRGTCPRRWRVSADGLTWLGRWLSRRGPFMRGVYLGFVLPAYLVAGLIHGFKYGGREWVPHGDGAITVARAPPPPHR